MRTDDVKKNLYTKIWHSHGLKIDFKLHFDFFVKKNHNFCGYLYRLHDVLTTAQLNKIYFSQTQPLLQYVVIVYGTANETSKKNLEMKQNQYLRYQSVTYFRETYRTCSVKELHTYEVFKSSVRLLWKDLKTEFLKNLISLSDIEILDF